MRLFASTCHHFFLALADVVLSRENPLTVLGSLYLSLGGWVLVSTVGTSDFADEYHDTDDGYVWMATYLCDVITYHDRCHGAASTGSMCGMPANCDVRIMTLSLALPIQVSLVQSLPAAPGATCLSSI